MNPGKILKNLNDRATGFDQLSIRRINCQISGSNMNASFKASLKLLRDKRILISFSKLNIPVGRIMLTADSVIYVNYMERNFFEGSYDFVREVLNLNVDFQDIQAIIFNNFFSYYNNPEEIDLKDFISFTESGNYVLQSTSDKRLSKFYNKWKFQKAEKYLKKKNEDGLIVQTAFIEPVHFNILKMIFEDKTENQKMTFDFSEFSQVNGRDYPGSVDILFDSPDEMMRFNIKMYGFSTDDEGGYDLKIPERYTLIRLQQNIQDF